MLQRIRVLAVQAANGTNTKSDRKALQEEVQQLCAEISRIGRKTTFAGAQILDGKPQGTDNSLLDAKGHITFQVGANANDTLDLSLSSGFTFQGILDSAWQASADPDKDKIFKKPTLAGGDPTAVGESKTTADHATGLTITKTVVGKAAGGGANIIQTDYGFSISTASLAQMTLAHIDEYIQYVDSSRAALGALQNRMESTIRNQASISENESDARSRIRDTDFASETAALTQNNIIQQASQTILSQANQRPTIALSLLGG